MNRNTIKQTFLSGILAALMVFGWGCSSDYTPTSSSSQTDNMELTEATVTGYSQAEGDAAGGPAPGFEFLTNNGYTASGTLDDPPVYVSRFMRVRSGGYLSAPGVVGVQIDPWELPNDLTVSISVPDPEFAVADFGPHPLLFNGWVEIWWDVFSLVGNDPDFDYESLVPWYINDDGVYEPVQHEWYAGYHWLVVRTNHFSRYIIGKAVTIGA
ncbi:MAG: hypothetical protein ACOZB3_07840 [Calditrichota bacterium]